MPVPEAVIKQLTAIPHLKMSINEPLGRYTRFDVGGSAAALGDAGDAEAAQAALQVTERTGTRQIIIGGGTNLVVSDAGFDGVVVRYTGAASERVGMSLHVEAGALLQDVVDQSITFGLQGLETMTGIPGSLGGAVYGNAGAYGHSMQELVTMVQATDGARVKKFTNAECHFGYRESVFKHHKEWLILAAELRFTAGNACELKKTADEIRAIRDAKYPPTMKCAGSFFKNLFFAELPVGVQAQVPQNVVREGKVPSAWFLEQVGAKGMRRGDIQVADYHANLIYNDGAGTAADVVAMIQDLKQRVYERFGFELEEEVQYV